LIVAATELALQNQDAWAPTLRAYVDRLTARTATIFPRARSDGPTSRSP